MATSALRKSSRGLLMLNADLAIVKEAGFSISTDDLKNAPTT